MLNNTGTSLTKVMSFRYVDFTAVQRLTSSLRLRMPKLFQIC